MDFIQMKNNLLKKYCSLSNAVKASLWFAICNFMQKGISMVTVPIFTRLLTTEQYGIYSVYQSWYQIVAIFATLNLYSGVFNVGMIKYSDDRDNYTLSLQNLCTFITIILFGIYFIAQKFWNKLFGLSSVFIYAMFVELLLAPAFTFWSARERFEYKYKSLIVVTMILSIGSLFLGLIAVISTTYRAEARVFSFVLVQACVGLFFYIFNSVRCKKIFSMKYWRYGIRFNIPLLPHYLSQIVLGQADRIMINSIVNASKAAIYSVAYNISSLMNLVTNAINSSFVPFVYNALKNKEYKKIAKNTNIILLMIAVSSVLVTAFGPEIISLFAPKEYHEAIWIIPPVSASVYFMFLYPLFGNIEFYFEENKFVTAASVGGAILNIILNWIMIPIFGYIAAGYTTLVCYIAYAVGHYFFMKLILRKNSIEGSIYDNRFILLLSICVVLSTIGMTIVYKIPILRYGIITLIIIGFYLKRRFLKQVFSDIKIK